MKKNVVGTWHGTLRGILSALAGFFLVLKPVSAASEPLGDCASTGAVAVQVLGSGGPELSDQRVSTSYLLWADGRARLLVDTGPGSAVAFEHTGASFADIDGILYSHFHVDHSSDLPAYVKGSYFLDRSRRLPVFGPSGNRYLPSASEFLERLFGPRGVYPYLSDHLQKEAGGSYFIEATDVDAFVSSPVTFRLAEDLSVTAAGVNHGPLPALAWRIALKHRVITITGDASNARDVIAGLGADSDVLIAHHAIPEASAGVARNLHMPPSQIGVIAAAVQPDALILSHRMTRTEGRETQTRAHIVEAGFKGQVLFAEDGSCY